jgi:hypothetical protein
MLPRWYWTFDATEVRSNTYSHRFVPSRGIEADTADQPDGGQPAPVRLHAGKKNANEGGPLLERVDNDPANPARVGPFLRFLGNVTANNGGDRGLSEIALITNTEQQQPLPEAATGLTVEMLVRFPNEPQRLKSIATLGTTDNSAPRLTFDQDLDRGQWQLTRSLPFLVGDRYWQAFAPLDGTDPTLPNADAYYADRARGLGDGWHHVVRSYDRASGIDCLFVDNVELSCVQAHPPNAGAEISLGTMFRFWVRFLHYVPISAADHISVMELDELAIYYHALDPRLVSRHYRDVQSGQHYSYPGTGLVERPSRIAGRVERCSDRFPGYFVPGITTDEANCGQVALPLTQLRSLADPRYRAGHQLKRLDQWAARRIANVPVPLLEACGTDGACVAAYGQQHHRRYLRISRELCANWNYHYTVLHQDLGFSLRPEHFDPNSADHHPNSPSSNPIWYYLDALKPDQLPEDERIPAGCPLAIHDFFHVKGYIKRTYHPENRGQDHVCQADGPIFYNGRVSDDRGGFELSPAADPVAADNMAVATRSALTLVRNYLADHGLQQHKIATYLQNGEGDLKENCVGSTSSPNIGKLADDCITAHREQLQQQDPRLADTEQGWHLYVSRQKATNFVGRYLDTALNVSGLFAQGHDRLWYQAAGYADNNARVGPGESSAWSNLGCHVTRSAPNLYMSWIWRGGAQDSNNGWDVFRKTRFFELTEQAKGKTCADPNRMLPDATTTWPFVTPGYSTGNQACLLDDDCHLGRCDANTGVCRSTNNADLRAIPYDAPGTARDGSYLGLLKALAIMGAESFVSSTFEDYARLPESYTGQFAMSSYAQAVLSHATDLLQDGTLLAGDQLIQRGLTWVNPSGGEYAHGQLPIGYQFSAGGPGDLVVARKHKTSDRFLIGASKVTGTTAGTVTIASIDGQKPRVVLPTRRQGSTYVLDNTGNAPKLIQLDRWHRREHACYWPMDQFFDAEVPTSGNGGANVHTDAVLSDVQWDFSRFTTYVALQPSSPLKYRFRLTQGVADGRGNRCNEQSGAAPHFLWLRLRNPALKGSSVNLGLTAKTQNGDVTLPVGRASYVSGARGDWQLYRATLNGQANLGHGTYELAISGALVQLDSLVVSRSSTASQVYDGTRREFRAVLP